MGQTVALLLAAVAAAGPIPLRWPQGSLHGFPSMSDGSGNVVADGELTQELHGQRLEVRIRWSFRDGRVAVETDTFHAGRDLVQERFSWAEERAGEELRSFTADFERGRATSAVRRGARVEREQAHLDLPRGRSFAGYGTALAVAQLGLAAGGTAEITFVAFTPKPHAVTLRVSQDREERIPAAGRSIPCDRFTLHPEIPFPANVFVHARDAHLWLTRRAPPALLRAEQNLAAKDDPVVVIDVIPRGAAHPASARRPPRAPAPPPSRSSRRPGATRG